MSTLPPPIAPTDDAPTAVAATRLEPKYADLWRDYAARRDPASTTALVHALKPTIGRAVGAYGEPGRNGALIAGTAKRLTLDALDAYDPTRGGLDTHVMSHLQRLRRESHAAATPIRVPERLIGDGAKLAAAHRDFIDKTGRVPDDGALADSTGLSLRRIAAARRPPSISEGGLAKRLAATTGENVDPEVAVVRNDPDRERLEFIYPDLDPIDRALADHVFAARGRSRRESTTDVARLLRISPAAASQRLAKIQGMLDDVARGGF